MTASRPRICASVTDKDMAAIAAAAPLVDIYEVRIDLVEAGWREMAGRLGKPWLACNRSSREGGNWAGGEPERTEELLGALELGAAMVDIELSTPGVAEIVKKVKGRAECLLSYHNLENTPPLKELKEIVSRQLAAGADICKVVTTALAMEDGLTVLRLIREFPQARVIAFAMGDLGQVSRVLCPLAGGWFTFASLAPGRESAAGQLTAAQLREYYDMMENDG